MILSEIITFKSACFTFSLAILMLVTGPVSAQSGQQEAPPTRALTEAFLNGKKPLAAPVASNEFAAGKEPARDQFEGVLNFQPFRSRARMKVLLDTFGVTKTKNLRLKYLPDFKLTLVQDGQSLISVIRSAQRTRHPYWEFIAGTGSTWYEAADGDWNRAALPFALKEANQNCLHNGLLTFLYKRDGSTSNIAYQVGSETCAYLHVNLWGTGKADYLPGKFAQADKVIDIYRQELAKRLPLQPIEELASRFPGFDPGKLTPSAVDDITVYGLVTDKIHYRSACPTRFGPYPYCDEIALPSYSLAKSIFAGLAYMMVVKLWPEFEDIPITRLIPECRLRDGRWDDVTPRHLVNMATGNYRSSEFSRDESSAAMTPFFTALSHQQKLRFSCKLWPRKQPPGERLVYHTTDHYLLGTAMTEFLRAKAGPRADIFRDLIEQRLFSPLGLSQLSRVSQRTYDETAQPFTAYGLFFLADDIARLGRFLIAGKNHAGLFRPQDFERAMFRQTDDLLRWGYSSDEAYAMGFWSFDIAPFLACKKPTWVPFMSGYGGLIVALLPNGTVYYYFTDGGYRSWKDAAVEINKLENFCKE